MAENLTVVDLLDTIGGTSGGIVKGTKRAGVYVTGGPGIAWTTAELQRLQAQGVQSIVRIDQSNSILNFPFYVVKDIEPGASTISVAVAEVAQRARVGLRTGLYTFEADLTAVRDAVHAAGLDAHVDYCVANWNLNRSEAVARLEADRTIKWVQWASPTSNPQTLVPGSHLTLGQANVDLGVTDANWPAPLPPKKPPVHIPVPPKPHVKVTAGALSSALVAGILAVLRAKGVTHLNANETEAISLSVFGLVAYLKKDNLVQ